jgi:hypothetical protein
MNRRRVLTHVLLYFFLLMLLTVIVGCSNSNDTTATATVATYSISGVVTLTGVPLPGVTVTLSGNSTGTYTTVADGTYNFTGLTNGGTYAITPIPAAGHTFNPGSTVVIFNGSDMAANFVATATASSHTISGTVTGAGVSSRVKITFSSASTTAEVLTGTDGTYTSPSLPDGGPYTVTPYLSGYSFTPPNISDIILSGANSAGNDFVATYSNFTQADLEGTWVVHTLETGTHNGWSHANVTIDSTGTLSFDSYIDSSGGSAPSDPIIWTINSSTGVISESGAGGNSANHYTLASNKSFIAGTQHSIGTSHPGLLIAQKKVTGTVYANANIWSKNFVFHQLNVGSSNKWQYGAGSTSSTGAVSISSETDPLSGTSTSIDTGGEIISVDSSGIVSMSDNYTWKGFLSADKRTIVGTVTEGTEYHMMIIQIIDGQSSSYMQTVGALPDYMLATGADPAPFWAYQVIGISGGVMSSLDWACSNSAVTPPGTKTISVSSSGTVTSTNSDFNGQLSYDAKFMVGTETFSAGVFALDVIMY